MPRRSQSGAGGVRRCAKVPAAVINTRVNKPCDYDVVCGRGETPNHTGNKRFKALISVFKDQYKLATTKEDKAKLCRAVVGIVRRSRPGGRFLKFDPKARSYEDIGDQRAREKVRLAFNYVLNEHSYSHKLTKGDPQENSSHKPDESAVSSLLVTQQEIFGELVSKGKIQQLNSATNKPSLLGSQFLLKPSMSFKI